MAAAPQILFPRATNDSRDQLLRNVVAGADAALLVVAMCASWGNLAVAGDCDIPVEAGVRTITVVDDVVDEVTFPWSVGKFVPAFPNSRVDVCAEGEAVGSVTIEVPADCSLLRVFLRAPATSGVIVVSERFTGRAAGAGSRRGAPSRG